MRSFVPIVFVAMAVAACANQAAAGPPSTPAVSPAAIASATPPRRTTGPVPEPWGPAVNGLMLYGTTSGHIVTMSAAGGVTSTILTGTDRVPVLSPDGTRLIFERTAAGTTTAWVSDIDGTDARAVVATGPDVGWLEWAPDSHRILTVPAVGGDVTIVDVDSGSTTSVHAPITIREASWLADGRLLVASASAPGAPSVFATIAEDGTGYAVVPTTDATENYSVSGDGRRFAYQSWGTDPAMQGQIHVVDLASGKDTLLTQPDVDHNVVGPVFSPDDRWVMADRLDSVGSMIVLLPADGKGKPVELGPEETGDVGEAFSTWAPDGSALIVRYDKTGEAWKFDIASGSAAKVDWPELGGGVSWQRLAP